MVPDAPATFSITTDWPSGARIPSATMRARMSVVPPGPYGATIVTARDGQVCADAGGAADSAEANSRMNRGVFMPDAPSEFPPRAEPILRARGKRSNAIAIRVQL